jgi:hypothetical protein
VQWFEANGTNSLKKKVERTFHEFQALLRHGLEPAEVSRLYAAFTDVQIYFDQRSYAYARRLLHNIQASLRAHPSRKIKDQGTTQPLAFTSR